MKRKMILGLITVVTLSGCGNVAPVTEVATAVPSDTNATALPAATTAAQPTAAATAQPTAAQPTTAPTAQSATAVAMPTMASMVEGMLPAPLYAIVDGQVARLAGDGTSTAITDEPSDENVLAVAELTVSSTGNIAYITQKPGGGNTLVAVDANGEGRTVLFDVSNAVPSQPIWTPDGSMVVFAASQSDESGTTTGGIYVVGADGENLRFIQANSELPAAGSESDALSVVGYRPQAVSPDGNLLLVSRYSMLAELCDLAIVPMAGGEPIAIAAPDASLRSSCGQGVWAEDSKSVFVAFYPSEGSGYTASTGIGRADAATGAVTPLVPANADGGVSAVVSMAMAADGNLVAVIGDAPTLPSIGDADMPTYRIERIDTASGARTVLSETPIPGMVQTFWAPNGTGVVVQEMVNEGSTLTWVPASNETAQVIGKELNIGDIAWGQAAK